MTIATRYAELVDALELLLSALAINTAAWKPSMTPYLRGIARAALARAKVQP